MNFLSFKALNEIKINWTPNTDMYVPVGGMLSEVAALEDEDHELCRIRRSGNP